jgi:hypothetical protein
MYVPSPRTSSPEIIVAVLTWNEQHIPRVHSPHLEGAALGPECLCSHLEGVALGPECEGSYLKAVGLGPSAYAHI